MANTIAGMRQRAPAERTATEHDRYGISPKVFDPFKFFERHSLSKQGCAHEFGMNVNNFYNWQKQGFFPFSFCKALIERFAHNDTVIFENAVNKNIKRLRLPLRVTPTVKDWARKFDIRRRNTTFITIDGERLIVPADIDVTPIRPNVAPVQAAPEPNAAPPMRPLGEVLDEAMGLDRADQPKLPTTVLHSMEFPTPAGVMKMEVPVNTGVATPGERELLLALIIRLQYGLVAAQRERGAMEIRLKQMEATVESMRNRLQEKEREVRETEALRVSGEKSHAAVVADMTTPRAPIAARDAESVKAGLRGVPGLADLVDDLMRTAPSFPKGASLVS